MKLRIEQILVLIDKEATKIVGYAWNNTPWKYRLAQITISLNALDELREELQQAISSEEEKGE